MPPRPVVPEHLIARRKLARRLRLVPTRSRGRETKGARRQRPTPPHGAMCRVRRALIAKPARIGMKTRLGKILPRGRTSHGLPAARSRRARIGEKTTHGPDLPTGLQTCHGHKAPPARNRLLGNRARRTGRPRPRTLVHLVQRVNRGPRLARVPKLSPNRRANLAGNDHRQIDPRDKWAGMKRPRLASRPFVFRNLRSLG